MPEIVFKGKGYVCKHHLTVPYRPLLADATKGIGAPALDGNLVIHGEKRQVLTVFEQRLSLAPTAAVPDAQES